MATATGNYVCDNSSLANFKSWANAVFAALVALGWPQTTDTGQTQPNSAGGVPSSTYIYTVHKSTLAGMDLYLKMEYGYSSTSVAMRFTLGLGTDGAGNINTLGKVGPYTFGGSNTQLANQGATQYACYFSGDAYEFRMMMWQSLTSGLDVLVIERSKDGSGNNTTDHATLAWVCGWAVNNGAGKWGQQSVKSNGQVGPQMYNPELLPNINTPSSETCDGSTLAKPLRPHVGKQGNEGRGLYLCAIADIAEGATVSISNYGISHTCIASKQGFLSSSAVNAVAMRYE